MINKEEKKVFMGIYSIPTYSKRYVSFKSNNLRHYLKNFPFSLARRISMIAEKDSSGTIKVRELEALLLQQHYKYLKKELRNVKKLQKKKMLPYISTFNPNNTKALPIMKQTMENLKTSDRMRN